MSTPSTTTKAHLVERVYEKIKGLSKKEATDLVEIFFDSAKEVIEKKGKLKIARFGNFNVREKFARVGRNPQSGDRLTISARRVLTFKPSQRLKEYINSHRKSS